MKRLLILPVAFAAFTLSSCGLRGDLERPDPLWGEPAEEETVVAEEVQVSELRPRTTYAPQSSYKDPQTGETIWVENANGGDKPLASPVKPVEDEGGLPPLSE